MGRGSRPTSTARRPIRTCGRREVTSHVSAVSAVPVVREWVNAKLRALARAGVGVVVDGRDIGTVVFPEADLKVFLTATPEARARRRLEQRGATVDADELARETERLALRDRADASRAVAPLRRAADAVEVDTTATLLRRAGRTGSWRPRGGRWPTSGIRVSGTFCTSAWQRPTGASFHGGSVGSAKSRFFHAPSCS